MKPSEIKTAATAELIARYARVRIDGNRFEELAKKAEIERQTLYIELTRERKITNGLYVLDGRKVVIRTNNGITVSTPVFKDLEGS